MGLAREASLLVARHQQRVVVLYGATEPSSLLDGSSIEVSSLGLAAGTGSRNWWRAVGPLRTIIRQYRPDVVQTSLFLGNLVGQIAAGREGVPVVSNLVLSGDRELLRRFQPRAETLRAGILRRMAAGAARRQHVWFRALTNEVKRSNASLLGLDTARIRVVPRGVPIPPPPTERTRAELGLAEGRLVLNVGRIAPQKNQVDLVRAMALVRAEVPDARLVLVGRPDHAMPAVEEEIRSSGVGDRVDLLGHRSDVVEILRHGSVFAFTSLMEGLGTAVLEALSVGLGVVAYDIPPVREAVDGGRLARLVAPGDVAGLADVLVEELERPGGLGAAGRDWVLAERNLSRIADEVERLLIDVVGLWREGQSLHV